ncbi:hypothetical protein ANANG_G00165850 [Anguilla anguilla]|uniref:Rieske domain-containing protein n=1 Tax=Anguilla anguilla TaxID=7936 RepID=A0A9D3MF79_ANGAN|nr:hypothetical protein ANANG_G00165850 [Anguilla anguilla]
MSGGLPTKTSPDPDPDSESEEVTEEVCLESELQDGEMMEVEVGHHNVLLVRSGGHYSAIGNQCTHYGAPLSKGALSGNRVRCPWHGACFNVKTGDLEEFPGLDCLPCHKVEVRNSKVFVSVNKQSLKQRKRVKEMGRRDPGVIHTMLLIGGGSASLVCAETLRQQNYGGRIVMVTSDDLLPYDKTTLSKVMNVQSDSILLRQMEFFLRHDIEVWLRKEAKALDTGSKTVTFSDGSWQSYDQLLISTGCRARKLDCAGADLQNVCLLQTPEDARRIHYSCFRKHVVIVGTSFIGGLLHDGRARSVTVIGSSELPYQKTLGPEIGRLTLQMLAAQAVKFFMNDSVLEIRGESGKVKEVLLKSGTVLPVDVLIVGIGVVPNSEFLQGSQVELDSKNFVPVDKCMRTSVPGVFCAGDLACFPLTMAQDRRVNIGHWQMAQAQGRIAALNMLNRETELSSVPFYWTVLLGNTIRYAGFGEGYTEMVLKGRFEDMKFLAFYIKDDVVVAVTGLNFDPAISQVAERLATGKAITKAMAESDDLSWLKLP